MNPQAGARRLGTALAAFALAVAVVAVLAPRGGHWPRASEYQAFESPDGRHRIVVYAFASRVPLSPGQGGDAGGFVRLYDRSGRLLREAPVDRVQRIANLRWEDRRVEIPLFAEWDLPPLPVQPR